MIRTTLIVFVAFLAIAGVAAVSTVAALGWLVGNYGSCTPCPFSENCSEFGGCDDYRDGRHLDG